MNSQASKVKVFCITALALSAVGAALYVLSWLLAADGTDYFVSGHPLPTLANIFSIVSVLWFACALLLIPKDTLPTEDFIAGKPCAVALVPLIGTIAAGAISFTYYEPVTLLRNILMYHTIDVTTICAILTAIGFVCGIMHYFLRMLNFEKLNHATVLLGIGPIALMTGLCGLTYFEADHHMNAPIKIALHLAWMATMLYLTGEMRFTLGKAQPRRFLACACIALFANACASISLIPLLINSVQTIHKSRIAGFSLLCLCNGIYVAYRLIRFTSHCNVPSPSSDPVPEQTQGKDDQDGCQQQDPMAS